MSTCITRKELYPLAPLSDLHRWLLASVMVGTILLGWQWPVFGFIVPVTMAVGIGGSFLRGRYVCGNICPRGSFYDTVFRALGGTRPVPALLTGMRFRWAALAVLMSMMTLQIAQNPSDPMHWGRVFWLVCLVTTLLGVGLGMIYRPRTWCSFCPVGTLANAIGGEKDRLEIGANCKECGSCEKACPMDLSIASHKDDGVLPHRDCLKCSSCVESCKLGALSFASNRN